MTESQDGNSQRAEDLEPIQDKLLNITDISDGTNPFTQNSSFDHWAAHDSSISSEHARLLDKNMLDSITPNPDDMYQEMSTPEREFYLNLEKTFDE